MKNLLLILLLTTGLSACSKPPEKSQIVCSPLGYDKAQLLELRAAKFEISDAAKRDEFLRGVTACLGHPDPDLRDKVAYEAFAQLLRSETVPNKTVLALRADLLSMLEKPDAMGQGFIKPFAALALSEVVRVDRKTPIFTPEQRAETVNTISNYMRSITDYRGYDSSEGWRHGVAHSADVLLQLSLNPEIEQEDLAVIQEAVLSQIVPQNGHFYIYGEPGRLARPIVYLAARDAFTPEEWTAWFEKIADPAPFENWGDMYSSQEGLAKLHNTKAFANAVYSTAINSKNTGVNALAEPALNVLRQLP
ncbi:MAG: DUF2785 domain-containing protein [Hellea sp.]